MMKRFALISAAIVFVVFAFMACQGNQGTDDDDDDDDTDFGDDEDDDDGGDDDGVSTDPSEECRMLDSQETAYKACYDCLLNCNLGYQAGVDFSDGPCLKEAIIEDWACDIIHDPRTSVDDLNINQCQQYPEYSAHIIETTPKCRFVRAS